MNERILEESLEALSSVQTESDKAGILARRAIDSLNDPTKTVARACMLLHWFNSDIISALLPVERRGDASTAYKVIVKLPFTEETLAGARIHELSRNGFLAHEWTRNFELFKWAASQVGPIYERMYRQGVYPEKAIVEALYCFVLDGQGSKVRLLLNEIVLRLGDWRWWEVLIKAADRLQEAKSQSFVTLPRLEARHWIAIALARRAQGRQWEHCLPLLALAALGCWTWLGQPQPREERGWQWPRQRGGRRCGAPSAASS